MILRGINLPLAYTKMKNETILSANYNTHFSGKNPENSKNFSRVLYMVKNFLPLLRDVSLKLPNYLP
jgi:hypothetical protein